MLNNEIITLYSTEKKKKSIRLIPDKNNDFIALLRINIKEKFILIYLRNFIAEKRVKRYGNRPKCERDRRPSK